jgi:hypothetical protein
VTIVCWLRLPAVPGGAHFRVAIRRGFLATVLVLLVVPKAPEYRPQLRAWWVELRSELVPFSLALAGGTKWLENWESLVVDFERELTPN